VRTASGSSQGRPLLKTCFQRCGDGVAGRDQILSGVPKKNEERTFLIFLWFIPHALALWRSSFS